MSVSGNTVERFDAPEGDFCRNPTGRAEFARPVRRRAGPMSPHRAAHGFCRIGQIRQRRGHGDYSNSLLAFTTPGNS